MKTIKVFLLASILLLGACMTSAYAIMAADYISVTEDWSGLYDVNFTITSSYDDITAFAVGTNYSYNFGAKIEIVDGCEIPSDWQALAVVKDQNNGWQSVEYVYNFETLGIEVVTTQLTGTILDLMNALDSEYTSAFLYYGTTALKADVTFSGFVGKVYGEDSAYVALRSLSDGTTSILTGETTTTVPVPGAAVLLLSGMIALAGTCRTR